MPRTKATRARSPRRCGRRRPRRRARRRRRRCVFIVCVAERDWGLRRGGLAPQKKNNAHLSSNPNTLSQESRDTLARLKRMAGFEAQDFDPVVRVLGEGFERT